MATPFDSNAGRDIVKNVGQQMLEDNERLGLSPRQMELNRLWAFYRCCQYDARGVDWDGYERVSALDQEAVAMGTFTPPGYYDAGRVPIKFRRPTAPYQLVKVIVDRFTGLLFSEKSHPILKIDGDPDTEDFAQAIIEEGGLWQAMMLARRFGGATGTAVVGFQFVGGQPLFEVHDPRWCRPKFVDRHRHVLGSIEIRYQYPVEQVDEKGRIVEVPHWYRRVIDRSKDVVYESIPVKEKTEPDWQVEVEVTHGLGFCPVVWIQNIPCTDDVDGDSDCLGIYDLATAIDALLAQANRGVIANCFGKETAFITSDGVRRFADLRDGATTHVLSHSGEWRRAVVKSYGKQELWGVTLQRGSAGAPIFVRATRNHRWLLADGSVTERVEVGDRIASAPQEFRKFEYETATDEEKVYWRRGFVWGDGSAYRSPVDGKLLGSRLRLCGEKTRYAKRFVEGGFKANEGAAWLKGDVDLYCRDFPKALPDPVEEPINLLRAFVRGFVDADGSRTRSQRASTRWKRIQVSGRASVEFVRAVFPAVGLYISQETDMSAEATNFGPRATPTVRFELNENASTHPNSSWRVVAVEPLEQCEEVWCLEVEEDHSFVLPCGFATMNCDPTTVISTDAKVSEIAKGSDNAIKLPANSTAAYLELTGSGPKAAIETADKFRAFALEVSQCVLEHPDTAQKTATEVERVYSSMLSKADILREQYGRKGVIRLMDMVLRAANKVKKSRVVQGADPAMPRIESYSLDLPPKYEKQPDGSFRPIPRQLGPGGHIKLVWPRYFEPGLQDAQQAVDASSKAKIAGLIDAEHATAAVAEFFDVEDPAAMQERIKAEAKEREAEARQMMMRRMQQPGGPGRLP